MLIIVLCVTKYLILDIYLHRKLLYTLDTMSKKALKIILSFIIITTFSCSQFRKELSQMKELKEEISKEYDIENIKINITNHQDKEQVLNILIGDSKFNNYNTRNKQKLAFEIGKLAFKVYNPSDIILGKLTFEKESNYGLVKTSNSNSYKMK